MKTLAPCCEKAEGLAGVDQSGTAFIKTTFCDSDGAYQSVFTDVRFCPWCGKRFEVVEAVAS